MTRTHGTAREMLRRWDLHDASLTPISTGLINLTFRVDSPRGTYVLQRLHPIFRAELHLDIEAITSHLAEAGMETPRLVRTLSGALWAQENDPHATEPSLAPPRVWRLQTALPGRSIEAVERPAQANSAGALLGRFHRTLMTCQHQFHFIRQAHGLARHRRALEEALLSHPHHRLADAVAPLSEALLSFVEQRTSLDALPTRITHGDPKISNLLFCGPEDRAHAWVDLDTLGRLALPVELGDAFRSWCNPRGEDGEEPALDLTVLEAALAGYAREASGFITALERDLLVEGILSIAAELACRFAADALRESYFGWNASRFPTRGDHNLHRARGQWALARSVERRRAEAEALVRRAFASL